jgi:hypothetical protein
VLQHDSKPYVFAGLYQPLCPGGRDLERLFEEHVPAGGGAALDELEVRIGRREDQHRIDRAILEDGLEPLAERKAKASGKGRAPRAEGL